jgi:hypothetical protein
VSKARATSAKSRELQGKNAAAKRWNHPDKDEIGRSYAEQRIAEYIERVLAQAPPLSDEQRTRLAELLRPARRAGGGAGSDEHPSPEAVQCAPRHAHPKVAAQRGRPKRSGAAQAKTVQLGGTA